MQSFQSERPAMTPCAVLHRGFDLAEEGFVVDAGREDRPRNFAGNLRHRRAGLFRSRIGYLEHFGAGLERQALAPS